ncbi:RING-H2 finger protein ATL46-like [Phoenix dactylifera]|uniref:RING-type E3 ubiquitin transferase n=1 Tax=Phoenix dactylifera TaxID=42345 RepID=A0A8B9AE49_PHODC|nr:RING-H2 finger protein ATL46-like [Phoenix dactylifera]
MVVLSSASPRTASVLPQTKRKIGFLPPFPSPQLHSFLRDSLPLSSSQPPPSPPSPSGKISPAVLLIIVILAVIFFISGLLHLLVRFLIKKHPSASSSSHSNGHQAAAELSGSEALQRQLQQLFHLHDSGLDQAYIDALPVFLYKEIVGAKEPFDCAVCLSEFAANDKLRLLPFCGHAFHIICIDTWLLSNSTCPLCRGALFVQGLSMENPIFDFEESREEGGFVGDREDGFSVPGGQKPAEVEEIAAEMRVFPVRLGKFKNPGDRDGGAGGDDVDGNGNVRGNVRREEGESSSSSLDARRCYSMCSYQYVLGEANLQVSLCTGSSRIGNGKGVRGRGACGNSTSHEVWEGKRLGIASKGESFSVSKIWQWSNKKEGKLPISSFASSVNGGLPLARRGVGDT